MGVKAFANSNDRTVWVTGASSGIGRATAIEFAKRGAHVVLTARSQSKLEEVAAHIRSLGRNAWVLPVDLARTTPTPSMLAELPAIDILIANAGDYFPTTAQDVSAERYMALMQLNFGGMLRCIEAVLPSMLQRRCGVICGVASVVGYRGVPRASIYGASKAAMINFLESLRFDLEPNGIQVTIVSPGFVETPLTAKNTFPMPFMIKSEDAARRLCDGLLAGRREVHFPYRMSYLCKLMRILPFPIYHAISRRMTKGDEK
ncbi:MAG: SDR family NAD(P)-dependent oxidoreductase [Bdellovibrionota bacterium]|nr:MAG: SDR family NAD(P)-dependent oxidoreductase [Bdellovibrionota bacterium]